MASRRRRRRRSKRSGRIQEEWEQEEWRKWMLSEISGTGCEGWRWAKGWGGGWIELSRGHRNVCGMWDGEGRGGGTRQGQRLNGMRPVEEPAGEIAETEKESR